MEKQTIAIIEDDEILARTLREELIDAGFNVVHASNGTEGLEIIKKEKPDLVLLDLLLPEMNGMEVLHHLREDDTTKDIPVIILTVVNELEKIAEAVKGGVYTYLIKDKTNLADLVSRIKFELKEKPQKTLI